MYRQYENPRMLQVQLDIKRKEYAERLAQCESVDERYDIIEMYTEIISDLEERVNFAWQDEEFG